LRNVARSSYSGVVPAPPGVDILAPPEVPRNASEARAKSEGRAKEGAQKARPKGIIRPGSL
jgi:hypothetical protein